MNRRLQRYFRAIAIALAICIFPSGLYAQISKGGLPISLSSTTLRKAVQLPKTKLNDLSVASLINEDIEFGRPFRYGIADSVNINLKTSGVKTAADSGAIWRYELEADSAKSIKLIFSKYIIPQAAKLFIYNSDYSVVYGAFTSDNMRSDSSFSVADFPGSSLIIEYYEPENVDFSGTVVLSKVSQAYRDVTELISDASEDTTVFVDVNCSGGVYWQKEKHSVCRYTFTEGMDSYLCSGALINNVNNDGTPYFLTANHCVSTSTVASTVVAYFNYETKACGQGIKDYKTLSGASLKTVGESSDYSLLEFDASPPTSYQPYYAGWDLSSSSDSTTGIHHPLGILKKISFDNDPVSNYAYRLAWDEGDDTPANSHWLVYFDEGEIASGSSGSPLFNTKRRIIGQLHGSGDTDCYYGKLSYSWSYPDASYSYLKKYLANGTDSSSVDGYYPTANIPDPAFVVDDSITCPTSPVYITDLTAFDVSSWEWKFSPSTVTFLDGTSASSQNPVVSFDNLGSYDIKLVVSNASGSDSVSYTDVVTVVSSISLTYETNLSSSTCYPSSDTIVITASQASSYTWELDSVSRQYFYIADTLKNTSQAVVVKKESVEVDSTMTLSGIVYGVKGTCSDSLEFSFVMSEIDNDNVEDAIELNLGLNGEFSNTCATVEDNEPKPSYASCTSQRGWCAESSGGTQLDNSVWFYFIPPYSGALTIKTTGSNDGQIALYQADTYDEILSGDYSFMAANDDSYDREVNSEISSINVTRKLKYWLQYDGSDDGSEGKFYLQLSEERDADADKEVTIYPQPASDELIVESGQFYELESVVVQFFMADGKYLESQTLSVLDNEKISIPVKGHLSAGIYVMKITANGVNIRRRVLIGK